MTPDGPLSPFIPGAGVRSMTPRYSTATHLRGALYAYLAPRVIAADAMPDLGPIVQGVTRQNFSAMRAKVAARVRVAMRGRIAMDADLSDILDLLDALEDGYEGEEMSEGEDRRRGRGRARDVDPNGFGGGGYEGGGGRGGTGYGVNPEILDDAPLDCTDPDQWNATQQRGMDEEEEESDPYWEDEDNEERRRRQIAGSTGSQSIDDRIRMNRDRMRRSQDKRRQTIDRMRSIIKDAMSARDQPPEEFEAMPEVGRGSPRSSVLDPSASEIDDRSTGGLDRRRVTGDAALNSRSRMYANMRRIGTGTSGAALSYCPSNVGGSAPNFGSGASADFVRRYPWAKRVKI